MYTDAASLLATLRHKARVVADLRAFLVEAGSTEVFTPAVVPSPGVDEHLEAVEVTLRPAGADAPPLQRWLATSPEYAMKRLLAAGAGPIHQLGRAWRDGEVGRLHEPEFTLLEWYLPGADDDALMTQTEELVRHAAGGAPLRHRESEADAAQPFERLTFRQAFVRYAGFDPATGDERQMGRILRVAGVRAPRGVSRDDLEDLVLSLVVQPKLGIGVPSFITDWPVERAALARVRPGRDDDGAPAAARFELYACGVELCNGYHELDDAAEQRHRIEQANAARVAAGRPRYPVDEEFLAALEQGIGDCAGNALGVDRLALLLTDFDGFDELLPLRVQAT